MADQETPAPEAIKVHYIVPNESDAQFGVIRHKLSIRGPKDKLDVWFKTYKTGVWADLPEFSGAENATAERAGITGAHLSRSEGGAWQLDIGTVEASLVEYWTSDVQEVQKPIRTWRADSEDPPDLSQINLWEALKTSDPEAYSAYKYDGTTVMAGNTLALAKMINEDGITVYPMAAPIAIRVTVWDHYPMDMYADLNKTVTLLKPREGWTEAGNKEGSGVAGHIAAAALSWLAQTDRAIANPDGTWTRTETWMGADSFNPNLYPAKEVKDDNPTDPGAGAGA